MPTRRTGRPTDPRTRRRPRAGFGAAAVLAALAAVALGCSDGPGERVRDEPPAASASASTAAARAAVDSPGGRGADCPMEGLWRRCSVEERLERAGLGVVRDSVRVRHDFLDIPGDVYKLGRSELQLFVYPSAADRERDWTGIDTTRVAPRGERLDWPARPTLIVSNNLAAIILSLNDRLVERVQLALTAGLPAAGPPAAATPPSGAPPAR